LGIGDWGLGIGPNPQSPIPNPHKIENYLIYKLFIYKNQINIYFNKIIEYKKFILYVCENGNIYI